MPAGGGGSRSAPKAGRKRNPNLRGGTNKPSGNLFSL